MNFDRFLTGSLSIFHPIRASFLWFTLPGQTGETCDGCPIVKNTGTSDKEYSSGFGEKLSRFCVYSEETRCPLTPAGGEYLAGLLHCSLFSRVFLIIFEDLSHPKDATEEGVRKRNTPAPEYQSLMIRPGSTDLEYFLR